MDQSDVRQRYSVDMPEVMYDSTCYYYITMYNSLYICIYTIVCIIIYNMA